MIQITLTPKLQSHHSTARRETQACCTGQKPQESRRIEHKDHRHHEQHAHGGHQIHDDHHGTGHEAASLNRTTFMATSHCLTGCTVGEVLGMAIGTALGWGTLSMATMEFVDNAVMLVIPGAMDAGLSDPLFWRSLVVSLVLAGAAAFPVNRWLIVRGRAMRWCMCSMDTEMNGEWGQ